MTQATDSALAGVAAPSIRRPSREESGAWAQNSGVMMRGGGRVVTCAMREATTRLPDALAQGVILVESLMARDVVDEIGARLRVYREGGYPALDVVLFLLLMFASDRRFSIKEFDTLIRPHRGRVGAVASRYKLPSRASVSRLLSVVQSETLADFTPWLLMDGASAAGVLAHPAVTMRDGQGQGWHVFDFDPTVTTLRQRALPEGQGLPAPKRRGHEAKPGYPGRKRGDVQMSRATLQHAGSSLWLGIWTDPGNGAWRRASTAAIETVVRTCKALGHSTRRALLRVDGAAGNRPFIAACDAAEIAYVTRSARYEILDDPAIRTRLNAAPWFMVGDSGSGPSRQAIDLGSHRLQSRSVDEGEPVEDVWSRVVVSRFPADRASGTGRFEDGWHYELFLTNLPPDVMPAADVVTCYYQRTGIENRFHQEDRELGLDRIFSYHVPGQNLANLVGLFVWNLRVCRGFALAGELPALPPQEPLVMEPVADKVVMAPPEPDDEPVPEVAEVEAPPAEPVRADSVEAKALAASLGALDWPALMDSHAGFSWDASSRVLKCPTGKELRLMAVKREAPSRQGHLRFISAAADCEGCPARAGCTPSQDPKFRKSKNINLRPDDADNLAKDWSAARASWPRPHRRRRPRPVVAAPMPTKPQTSKQAWLPPALPAAVTLWAIAYAVLRPTMLRQLFVSLCRKVDVSVRTHTQEKPRLSIYYAPTSAHRQARRQTWDERLQHNRLESNADVHIRFAPHDDDSLRLLSLLLRSRSDGHQAGQVGHR